LEFSFNESLLRIPGYSQEEMAGMNHRAIVPINTSAAGGRNSNPSEAKGGKT
jgi:hypothetical protein